MIVGVQGLELSSAAIPIHRQGAGSCMEQSKLELLARWDSGATGRLVCFATASIPISKLFSYNSECN